MNLVCQIDGDESILGFTDELEALGASNDGARRHKKGRLIVNDHD
jgi:hypothetical protein